jgi:DNA replicative helicase MCM subunit Mcm2 (Cdc46/Mcm family)
MFGWFKKTPKTTYICDDCGHENPLPEKYEEKWFTATSCESCDEIQVVENKDHPDYKKSLDDAYKAWDNADVGESEDITTVPTIISLI